MFRELSIVKRIAGFFKPKTLADFSHEFREAVEAETGDEKIVHCVRAEKLFYKNVSSFAGETFFRTIAVITDRKLIVLKDSSEYNEIKSFPLSAVSGCSLRSDSGKPALLVSFSDGSENRFVFSMAGPETELFKNTLSRVCSKGRVFCCGQCGKNAQTGDRFCGSCGPPLDFTASEFTMSD